MQQDSEATDQTVQPEGLLTSRKIYSIGCRLLVSCFYFCSTQYCSFIGGFSSSCVVFCVFHFTVVQLEIHYSHAQQILLDSLLLKKKQIRNLISISNCYIITISQHFFPSSQLSSVFSTKKKNRTSDFFSASLCLYSLLLSIS